MTESQHPLNYSVMLRQSYTAQPGLNHDMLRLRPCDKEVPLIRSNDEPMGSLHIYIKEATITLKNSTQKKTRKACILPTLWILLTSSTRE